MFDVFSLFADRVRDQTREFADAQRRVGTRLVVKAFDPFDLAAVLTGATSAAEASTGADLSLPSPSPQRRKLGAKKARAIRKPAGKRPVLHFA